MIAGSIMADQAAHQRDGTSRVELTDLGVIYHQPDGLSCSVRWDTLRAVLIETTDAGPFIEDLWWILIDAEGHCIIPQEASGETEMFHRLQELPGFDNDAVIAAMGSVENRRFLCWQRQ
jgi:hypothetical protein